jgi:hypothetical protein
MFESRFDAGPGQMVNAARPSDRWRKAINENIIYMLYSSLGSTYGVLAIRASAAHQALRESVEALSSFAQPPRR